MEKWIHAVFDIANTVAHCPCWGCGAWMLHPHTPNCPAMRNDPKRYLVKRG